MLAARRLAAAVLGRGWIAGRERVLAAGTVLYVLDLDGGPGGRLSGEPPAPFSVRWFEGRGLAQGIGGDGGRVTWKGQRFEPA